MPEENINNNEENFEGEDFFEMTMEILKSNPAFDEVVEARNEELELIKEIEKELDELKAIADWNDEEVVSKIREFEEALLEMKKANGLID